MEGGGGFTRVLQLELEVVYSIITGLAYVAPHSFLAGLMDALLASVGISSLLYPATPRVTGVLKTRYSDFLVNEITESTNAVVHLTQLWPHALPAAAAPTCASASPADGTSASTPLLPATLETLIGAEAAARVAALVSGESVEPVLVPLPVDKAARRALHEAVRATSGTLDSETLGPTAGGSGDGGSVRIVRVGGAGVKRARPGAWSASGPAPNVPPFLHFTLHKVNAETGAALRALAAAMGAKERSFSFCGTKDKRGATVQRVALYRAEPARVSRAARSCRGLAVGDFEYKEHALHLGGLEGNAFCIVVRDVRAAGAPAADCADACAAAGAAVERALAQWRASDFLFISYFGLQRFGGTASLLTGAESAALPTDSSAAPDATPARASAVVPALRTHLIGRALLLGDFRGAVELVLAPRAGGDVATSVATEAYLSGQLTAAEAWMSLQRAGESLERRLLQALAKVAAARAAGGGGAHHSELTAAAAREAFLDSISAKLRAMHLHAYQSHLWNRLASVRINATHCALPEVVEGDLVLEEGGGGGLLTVGLAGEDVPEDVGVMDDVGAGGGGGVDDEPRSGLPPTRLVTAADVAAARYTATDILMPMPGAFTAFPRARGWDARALADLLREDGFTLPQGTPPGDAAAATDDDIDAVEISVRSIFAARDRRFACAGAYRPVVGRARDVSWELVRFTSNEQDISVTDFERVVGREPPPRSQDGPRLALSLRFSLDKSVYATVALRQVLDAI